MQILQTEGKEIAKLMFENRKMIDFMPLHYSGFKLHFVYSRSSHHTQCFQMLLYIFFLPPHTNSQFMYHTQPPVAA